MRVCFRLRVTGIEQLPNSGPFVITPNHASYLDGLAIAAAVPFRRFRQLYWAGDLRLLFSSRLTRFFARVVHLFPVDAKHPDAALEAARRVLQRGHVQVWFPEGWLSPDGRVQQFSPGIGELLLSSDAPAVPTYLRGTFEALPHTRSVPHFNRISVVFGRTEQVEILRGAGSGRTDEERIASALRQHLIALEDATGHPPPPHRRTADRDQPRGQDNKSSSSRQGV